MVATNREANSSRYNLGILPVWGCKFYLVRSGRLPWQVCAAARVSYIVLHGACLWRTFKLGSNGNMHLSFSPHAVVVDPGLVDVVGANDFELVFLAENADEGLEAHTVDGIPNQVQK